MKRRLVTMSLMSFLLFGCSTEMKEPVTDNNLHTGENDETETPSQDISITYSYLTDPTIQKEVKDLLSANDINDENIETYFKSVAHFNSLMKDMGGVYDGYKTLNLSELVIDEVYIYDTWMNQIAFPDLNCRTSVFTLIKDSISMTNLQKQEDYANYLMFDLDMLEKNINLNYTDEEKLKFVNLFVAIPAQKTTDISVHIADVLKTWETRGIKFQMNENLSLITIFMHDELSDSLYIGHTGLLIEEADTLYFLEKLSPLKPYVVSKFKSRDDLKTYLHLKYDMYSNGENAKPFFMENDEWMGN